MKSLITAVFAGLLLAAFMERASAESASTIERFKQAVGAQERGDYDLAVAQYRDLLKTDPNLLAARVNLGVSLVQLNRFPEAIESYQAALALDGRDRRIRMYLALAYFKSGDAARASKQFEDLLASNPRDIRCATLLAASYLQTGESVRALAILEHLHEAGGDDPDFLWALASAEVANGKLREGALTAEKVANRTNAAEAWKLAGENMLRLNHFVQAKVDLEAAARVNPDLTGLQTVLGQAREKSADYAGAIEAFRKAVKQNPKDFDAWLNLGSDLYFVRDLDEARASLTSSLALQADSAPALYALSLVDKSQGKADAAIAGLERAVKIAPAWIEAHVQLAALYIQARRVEEGFRERQIVDRLSEEERKSGPAK